MSSSVAGALTPAFRPEDLLPLLAALAGPLPIKGGPSPATEASIVALPVAEMTEEGAECPICLAEWEIGGEAKEMPCKHRFHPGCIEKWLRIYGSCPLCRHHMPVKEADDPSSPNDDYSENVR